MSRTADRSSPLRSVSYSASSTPAPSSSSRNNPISLRIYKAIGTSFDDPVSYQALEIASSYYASSASGTSKGRALPPVNGNGPAHPDTNSSNTQQPEYAEDEDHPIPMRRTLKGQSAAAARKYLKKDMDTQLASSAAKFLSAFKEVDEKLGVLRGHMVDMSTRCDQVQAELEQANSGTRYLLERADGLRNQRASAQMRGQIIELFLKRFTLSEEEMSALTDRGRPVGSEVFQALDKVEGIRRDSQALLGGEEGNMQAGLDIMATTGEQMEAGYKKIHRWCSFEFRQYTREGQLEVSPVMREVVQRLRRRPALLEDVLTILHTTRQSSTLQSFLDALTRGGPGGLPRPIELHAHDPTRYVGDMLAWVHQATASEHEFLQSLFGVKEKRRMVGAARDSVSTGQLAESALPDDGEEERMVREGMDKDLEGLGRPLKMRIQQTIKSQEGVIMAYKIANLVHFYLVTMRKTIGRSAALSHTLSEIYELAYSAFLSNLEAQGRSLLRFLHPPDANLAPPLALRETCQILREIIQVYENSLVDRADRAGDEDFVQLLDKGVEPAVEMCEKMADLRKGHGDWEKDIFLVNCLGYVQHTLKSPEFTQTQGAAMDDRIEKHVNSMTFDHHGKLLEQCGLAPIMHAIRTRPTDGTPLSRLPAASSKNLTGALTTFSSFLGTIDPASHPRLSLLQDPRLAYYIHHTALQKISEAYTELAELVLDQKEGYEFRETLLRRGKEEVQVALGVQPDDSGQ